MTIQQNYPTTRPSLSLNFARSRRLDPHITFTRTTSGTRVNEEGYIETVAADRPRFDHDPVTLEPRGLLIEEGRTNRCTQSANFNFSATTNIPETNLYNPDGTAAIRRVPASSGNFHGTGVDATPVNISAQAVGGTTDLTTSIFIRNYGSSNLRLLIGFYSMDNTGTVTSYFLPIADTANPVGFSAPTVTNWSNGSTRVENYGNGWYRYTLSGRYTKPSAGITTVGWVGEQIYSSTGQQFWTGDDVSGIYVWGKQRELGLFSTSYIPTSGSEGVRGADNASITGDKFSSFYNPSEGTIYCSANNNPGITTSTSRFFYAFDRDDGVSSDFIRKWIWNGATGSLLNSVYTSNTTGSPISAEFNTTLETTNKRTAIAYKQNDFARSYNGSTASTDTDGNVPVGVNRLRIGVNLTGTISQLTYYPVRLTNAQLQELTK